MDVFGFRDQLISAYAEYITSFIQIRDPRIKQHVNDRLGAGRLWPEPLIQLNPSFEPGNRIETLVDEGVLHEECRRVFRKDKDQTEDSFGRELRLHKHQEDAIRTAQGRHNYVLTTGTGSGKSLAYIIPIVDHVLRRGSGRGIQAVVVYPMNALANSQMGELRKFLKLGYPEGRGPVTFERYTGQESDEDKKRIMADPPDILLTNYVMLELIFTRPEERRTLVQAAQGLRFLVLDELHTYRGRQGADVALLVRRVRDALNADQLQCVGTSATLAGTGSFDEQRRQVANVARLLFGAEVRPEHVIGETLRRATPARDLADPAFVAALTQRAANPHLQPPTDYDGFVADPLSIWIESVFGLTADRDSGRLMRAGPRSIGGKDGAARELSRATGVSERQCAEALRKGLLTGYNVSNPDTGFPTFAFRLHQFISRGDTAYATLEPEDVRYITVQGQQYKPGDRSRVLLPLAFCRECGQEYYSVRLVEDPGTGQRVAIPRDLSDRGDDDEAGGDAGYLYVSGDAPWPDEFESMRLRLPDEWLEEANGAVRVRQDRRKYLPERICLQADGTEAADGLVCHYVAAPFRFCLRCTVSYGLRQSSDFAKLASLGSEGRSTATTILSLSAARALRRDEGLRPDARKLLSFTDNRQDASLQAGHFNDFVEIALLRSALYRAARDAGEQGLTHEALTQKVFAALQLPLELYAADPDVKFQARAETERALRDVLGYRLYRDLKRGWRITSPNLEQCGLLEIQYLSLDELCRAEEEWAKFHPALVGATPETRMKVGRVLLDYMRRELALKVDYLETVAQERILQQSGQRLKLPWALDENETMERAAVLFPRPSRGRFDSGDAARVHLSARGGFGQYLRRHNTFEQFAGRLTMDDTQIIIEQLLQALKVAGLVEVVAPPRDKDDVPGYQLPASALIWKAGDGMKAFHDPISVPNLPESGGRTNPFFVEFYRTVAADLQGLIAHEHTAQVPSKIREEREELFRKAELPILYCSPTMELGVDIRDLNCVNMRNVPPTPANYAQRSGRAGRSGQPALVFTYCALGSPHDQYFFQRPDLMVAGAVTPPRLDLANEDLVRAHIHAIWLAETEQSLYTSLKDILDLNGEAPSLDLKPSVRDSIEAEAPRTRARRRAERVLDSLQAELRASDWHTDAWLDEVLAQAPRQFDRTCDRWRGLYRAALKQRELQNRIIGDASRSPQDKNQARRLRQEAESQLELLTQAEDLAQSDFYSYRYFASEGFLPGYNFPRLPLSAYLPARRVKVGRDEFLSRPRFLAISEFGPRSIVYHEGSRYQINKVILPVDDRTAHQVEGEGFATYQVKQCPRCGYLHPVTSGDGLDRCERCDAPLDQPLRSLFRLQNVSTRRRDRISSDEEERFRVGYEIRTGVRFAEHGGRPSFRTAAVERDGRVLANLTYGHTATLWRINLGWRRRAEPNQYGFVLDLERGYWARRNESDQGPDDPLSARTMRVIPYVEDRRNCLLFEPVEPLDDGAMASLQAALENAVQVTFQLEDAELATEPLPTGDDRRLLLFYEAAEGGAGVLRRLVDDGDALARVARKALELCHFDPESGDDRRRADHAKEDCEAACYDCLMSYYNQGDHRRLDRKAIRDFLLELASARVNASPGPLPRSEHLRQLKNLCGSELEREWLDFLEAGNYRLPTKAQALIEACRTRPDFLYEDAFAAIYVDGPHHRYPERQARDVAQAECLEDQGYTVIRFGLVDDWKDTAARYPHIFGAST